VIHRPPVAHTRCGFDLKWSYLKFEEIVHSDQFPIKYTSNNTINESG